MHHLLTGAAILRKYNVHNYQPMLWLVHEKIIIADIKVVFSGPLASNDAKHANVIELSDPGQQSLDFLNVFIIPCPGIRFAVFEKWSPAH